MVDPARRSGALLRGLTMAAFAAALVYLFFGEHRVHLLGWAPFLLFFLCPLLHLTHHGRRSQTETHHDARKAEGTKL